MTFSLAESFSPSVIAWTGPRYTGEDQINMRRQEEAAVLQVSESMMVPFIPLEPKATGHGLAEMYHQFTKFC